MDFVGGINGEPIRLDQSRLSIILSYYNVDILLVSFISFSDISSWKNSSQQSIPSNCQSKYHRVLFEFFEFLNFFEFSKLPKFSQNFEFSMFQFFKFSNSWNSEFSEFGKFKLSNLRISNAFNSRDFELLKF